MKLRSMLALPAALTLSVLVALLGHNIRQSSFNWQNSVTAQRHLRLFRDSLANKMPETTEQEPGLAARTINAAAVPGIAQLAEDEAAAIVAAEPKLGPLLSAAQTASALRAFAETLGKQIAAPLQDHQPLLPQQLTGIHTLQARVSELHRLLLTSAKLARADWQIQAALEAMERHYFADTRMLIRTAVAASQNPGAEQITEADFAGQYGPALHAIDAVRDALLAQADAQIAADQHIRARVVWLASVGAIIIALCVGSSLVLVNRRVILPMQALVRTIIRLAEGDRTPPVPLRVATAEVAALAHAVDVLRLATLEADAAAEKRRAGMELAADGLRRVAGCLQEVETQYAALAEALPGLTQALSGLGPVPGGAASAHDEGRALGVAVGAVLAAMDTVKHRGVRMAEILHRLRSHCSGDFIEAERITSDITLVEQAVQEALDSVSMVPALSLSAIRQSGLIDGDAAAARKIMPSRLAAILAASEQVGAASGGLSGAITHARSAMRVLTQLAPRAERPLTDLAA